MRCRLPSTAAFVKPMRKCRQWCAWSARLGLIIHGIKSGRKIEGECVDRLSPAHCGADLHLPATEVADECEIKPLLSSTIISMRHEDGQLARSQHAARRSAKDQLAQPPMAIGAHHDEVGAALGRA